MKLCIQKFKYRKVALACADMFIVALAGVISNYSLIILHAGITPKSLFTSIVLSTITCLGGLAVCGAYNKLWRYFSLKDYISCVYGVLIGIATASIFTYILRGTVPLRYILLHAVITIIGICSFRLIFKETFIDLTKLSCKAQYKRTMIIGAGQASKMLLSEIRNAQNSPYSEDKSTAIFEPLCIIDDDRSLIGQSISDVQVVGSTAEIGKYVQEFKIEQIVFCIPSCFEDERKRILDICIIEFDRISAEQILNADIAYLIQ